MRGTMIRSSCCFRPGTPPGRRCLDRARLIAALAIGPGMVAMGGAPALANADSPLLFYGPQWATAGRSTHAAIGDFNKDGRPDLAVANYEQASVSILLSNGDGTFQPAKVFSAGPEPWFIAVADLDADGALDLAVATAGATHGDPGGISVLLGKGDGTFGTATVFPADFPRSLAVADLNGDGSLDLATSGSSGVVAVLLGNGDGTFQTPMAFVVGVGSLSIAIGDFDGNGIADLGVVTGGASPTYAGEIAILLGNGDGTFQDRVVVATGRRFSSVAIADLDGDAALDLAVAVRTFGGPQIDNVMVLRGNGDGTFDRPHTFDSSRSASSLVIGDFDGDAILDIAVAHHFSDDVSVLKGNGDATFQPPLNTNTGQRSSSIVSADFDGDGALDIALPHSGQDVVLTLLGNGNGTFQVSSTLQVFPLSIAVNDLNGDGIPDIAGGLDALTAFDARLAILIGNGDGEFQDPLVFETGGRAATFVAAGDVNGDGIPDMAVTIAFGFRDDVVLLLGKGDGTFGPPSTIDSLETHALERIFVLHDLNGDGRLDIVANNYTDNDVSILIGNGDGTFQDAIKVTVGLGPLDLAVDDMNGDGIPDLITANAIGNDLSILLGNGDGTFQNRLRFFPGGSPRFMTVADLNSDGWLDIAVTITFGDRVVAMLGNGDGTLQRPIASDAGFLPASVVAGDLDGDGALDLAVGTAVGISVLLGNRDGAFQPPRLFSAPGGNQSITMADLNLDGGLDLAMASTIVLNRCSPCVGDIDRDGDVDVSDFFAFVVAFVAGDPAADINGDGSIDVLDGFAFVVAFVAGCP